MVRVNPKGSEQTTPVSTRSSNQTSTASSKSVNESNTVKGTNDLAEYYAMLAKQYAEKAAIDVNAAIDIVMSNVIGTGNIDPEYANKVLIINDKTFVFSQSVASSDWTINHNLNKRPTVTVVDSGGNTFFPPYEYIDDDNLVVHFLGATTGTAYLN